MTRRGKTPRSWPESAARRVAIGALCAGLATACAVPGPQSREEDMGEIPRAQRSAPAGPPGPVRFEVSYLRGGNPDAPRILFVHGTPGKATGWADYLIDPPAGHEAIAIDRPGFGDTRPPHAAPSLVQQARALAPFLEIRKGRGPILVGHSLGAAVVLQAAVDYPDRVAALVLAAGSVDPDLERVLWIQRVGRWRAVEWMLPRWARNANRELISLEAELRALAPRFAELRCPVVLVHGTEDPLVPYANVAYVQRKLADRGNVELLRLDGVNHFLPWNSAAVMRKAIRRARELADAAAR